MDLLQTIELRITNELLIVSFRTEWRHLTKYNFFQLIIFSPEEFLLYVLECLMNDDEDTNPHWLPQYKSCPFCLVNFTVYSKMEEMHEDTAYVMYKAKLFGKILPNLKVTISNWFYGEGVVAWVRRGFYNTMFDQFLNRLSFSSKL